MEVDLQKLKAAAEAATPGPWNVKDRDVLTDCEGEDLAWGDATRAARFLSDDDAIFIAAANPSVVLALIAGIEMLRTSCREHVEALQRVGDAVGLIAGDDLHRDLAPAIERLKSRIQELEDGAPTRFIDLDPPSIA